VTSGRWGYREWSGFRQGVGEDRRGWEWGEGIVHIGGEDVIEVAHGSTPGVEVHEGICH